jgi:formate C-acetyltransferase
VQSFDAFYAWYKQELAGAVDFAAAGTNLLDETYGQSWPIAFCSATYGSAFRKGLDVTRGGAKYPFSSINGTGMADAVDSLLAIKRIVYDEKQLSLEALAEILKNDFEGQEPLRRRLSGLKGRYGNDAAAADSMMGELADLFVSRIRSKTNPYGERYQAGFYSVYHHSAMGQYTAALPSGRKAGAALANGFSACQGQDVSGPTAAIRSVLCTDHAKLANGMVLDIKFLPSFLEGEAHRRILRDLVGTYFAEGGMEIQFNVIGRETLLDAQRRPEAYGNLIVRISGYSAYYTTLAASLQDEIIARTENG